MKSWALPAAIQLEYETRTLARRKDSNDKHPAAPCRSCNRLYDSGLLQPVGRD